PQVRAEMALLLGLVDHAPSEAGVVSEPPHDHRRLHVIEERQLQALALDPARLGPLRPRLQAQAVYRLFDAGEVFDLVVAEGDDVAVEDGVVGEGHWGVLGRRHSWRGGSWRWGADLWIEHSRPQ